MLEIKATYSLNEAFLEFERIGTVLSIQTMKDIIYKNGVSLKLLTSTLGFRRT